MLNRLKTAARHLSVSLLGPMPAEPEVGEYSMGELEQIARVAREQLSAVEVELATARRISGEYFETIEKLSDQREEWKDMFFTQGRQHHGAQAMLERALSTARVQLRIALESLKKHDEKEVELILEKLAAVDAPPIGMATQFAEEMLKLAKGAKEQTDGKAERERISQNAAQDAAQPDIDEELVPRRLDEKSAQGYLGHSSRYQHEER